MRAISNIEKRLDSLEKEGNNDRTLIFVDYEGANMEDSTRHIYNQCEKCSDPGIFAKALSETTKTNQGNVTVITREAILDVVERLKAKGCEVSL